MSVRLSKTCLVVLMIIGVGIVSGMPVSAAGTYVSGTISADTTWNPAGSPYAVDGEVVIPAGVTLTIASGTVVKFTVFHSRIVNNGTIAAHGTSEDRIYFTSIADDSVGGDTNNDGNASSPARANWNHIWTTGSGATASFSYCDVRYGGWYDSYTGWSYPGANLGCTGGGTMTVDHCVVTESGTSGIHYDGMTSPQVTNSTVSSNSAYGIYMNNCPSPVLDDNVFTSNGSHAAHLDGPVGTLNFNRNAGTGNATNALFLNNNLVTGAGRWHATNGLPYVIENLLAVDPGASLIIDPGTIVKFNNYYSRIQSSGVLVVEGTSGSHICFTSVADDTIGGDTNNDGIASSPARSNWNHIWTTGSGATASFAYCDIRYGGWYDSYTGWSYPGADLGCTGGGTMTVDHCAVTQSGTNGIYYDGMTSPQVTNSTVSNNSVHGIYMNNCPSPVLDDNVFNSNTQRAAHLDGPVGVLNFNRNSGTGSGINGLFLNNNTVTGVGRWYATNGLPYVIENQLTVNAGDSLTIDPGTIVKFHSYYSRIQSSGALLAEGTSDSHISFTSIADDTIGGDTNNDGTASSPARSNWNHIWTTGSGAAASFSYCEIRYGGWYDYYSGWSYPGGNLSCTGGGTMTVDHCAVIQSGTSGIYYDGMTSPQVTNSTVSSNSTHGIYMNNCPSPILDDNILDSNTQKAAYLEGPVGVLNFNRNTGAGNGINALFLNNNTVTGPGRWHATNGLPYVIENQLTVNAGDSLTIDPGTIVKFNSPYSRIHSSGAITAEGTSDSRISFTSIADDTIGGDTNNDGTASPPAPSNWNHIWTTGSGATASFAYCDVRYGGWYDYYTGWSYPAGNLGCTAGGTMTVDHCAVTESGTSGIYYDGVTDPRVTNSNVSSNSLHGIYMNNSPSPVLDDDLFSSNTTHAAHMDGAVGTVSFNSNSGSGSGVNGLFLSNNTVSADCRWSAADSLPLVVENQLLVNSGATLTIDPDVVIKMNSYYSRIVCNGSIVAQGTALSPVYFTSIPDDSIGGDTNNNGAASSPARSNWNHIWVNGPGAAGEFEYCVIRYGGWYDPYTGWSWPQANLAATGGAALEVRNCTVAESAGMGVYSTTSGTVCENNIFAFNATNGVQFSASDCRIAYCDFWANTNGELTGTNPTLVGNIYVDPLFVDRAAGDYHLQDTSPCMNAGDPSKLDLDGSVMDIGALPNLRMGILTAKGKADGETVAGVRGVVTAVFGDAFYMESAGRYTGIRVRKSGHTVTVGKGVTVNGVIRTEDGERYIDASTIVKRDGSPLRPLGVNTRSLGGADWFYNADTGAGQQGVLGAAGLNNVGLLVRIWGKVTHADTGFFYLDDGSGIADDSGFPGIKIETNGLAVPDQDSYVCVIGISSCSQSGKVLYRLIRATEITPQTAPD